MRKKGKDQKGPRRESHLEGDTRASHPGAPITPACLPGGHQSLPLPSAALGGAASAPATLLAVMNSRPGQRTGSAFGGV